MKIEDSIEFKTTMDLVYENEAVCAQDAVYESYEAACVCACDVIYN